MSDKRETECGHNSLHGVWHSGPLGGRHGDHLVIPCHPGLPPASAMGKASPGVKARGKTVSVPDRMCPDGGWNSLRGPQDRVYL